MGSTGRFLRILATALVLGTASGALAAEDGVWHVSKSSGQVWMMTTGAQPVSLGQEEVLKPGDTVRTGGNGRVLLTRGEETILVSPNSVIGLPTEKKDGLPTTIVQQAGSILLEVEKRNVQHFEVETPYLAAVVKGTKFRVSVNAASTSVDVLRGQVEVADFKSGQIAQVMPGQVATAFAHGKSGLSLSGSGTFNPIEQGKP
ncbi:MAG: FecR family protein, partial [Bradyrhizobium sp.]